MTAEDLKEDLLKVYSSEVEIVKESNANLKAKKIIIGTFDNNETLKNILKDSGQEFFAENPGYRGGIWQKVDSETIILAGSDIQGMQYAIYDYSKIVLNIDPLIYWSGHSVSQIDDSAIFNIDNKIIEPPTVPLLVYFENDVDELMNLKEPLLEYDWESYTEMIDALIRMRYNGIQLFDLLGRAEFYLREEYMQMVPDYDIDIDYIEEMIDYAQDKGMYVQIDLSLGYKIRSLESKYADCWSQHKAKWLEVWKYYLEETPLGKADIFSLRPRNQVWDWEYKSTCGEDKIEVFNEVYEVLDSLIESHNSDATKVLICYADGMTMYNEGFRPPDDWIVAWSDHGYADFEIYPNTTDGYQFGTYMHAGFWKNHTVAHPYPRTIDTIMHKMFDEYDATAYCQVNGQQFRPFLLNLEAFSEVCRNPDEYTGSSFYKMWAQRYFSEHLQLQVIELMDEWDEASFGHAGYVQNLWEIKEVIAYLAELPIQSPGKSAKPFTAERVHGDIENARIRNQMIQSCFQKSTSLIPETNPASAYYYDQIHFPLESYADLLSFEVVLHQIFDTKLKYEKASNENLKTQAKMLLRKAKVHLEDIIEKTMKPAKDPKWNGWYDISKRRPNNGFPTMEMLNEIDQAIEEKW
ncbi:hypothetical protein GCM10007940_25140 [Portibacter lacus]|uniref:Uncharacterized protein n=2 Tax=Portibacter lacus TaxID=1099794 RepID=A0AA37SQP1_9BACT|nr:hypothetical protein GCM10007940_25140 [Portibacter lacus]